MNTKRAIEAIERQSEFLVKEISKVESQLADHIWKADSYGMQPYGAGPTRKATLLERKIAQLKSYLEKNNVRTSKLMEIGNPSCSTRDRHGFITAPHVKSAKEIAEDAAEQDLNKRYEEHMRRQQ